VKNKSAVDFAVILVLQATKTLYLENRSTIVKTAFMPESDIGKPTAKSIEILVNGLVGICSGCNGAASFFVRTLIR
jgi:hypothetical protein